uniref:Uncharacterized protein n=1 Tax=Micrurus paraensis TaxID=1970185 RepID=A0A2D4JSF6_9SAUR
MTILGEKHQDATTHNPSDMWHTLFPHRAVRFYINNSANTAQNNGRKLTSSRKTRQAKLQISIIWNISIFGNFCKKQDLNGTITEPETAELTHTHTHEKISGRLRKSQPA